MCQLSRAFRSSPVATCVRHRPFPPTALLRDKLGRIVGVKSRGNSFPPYTLCNTRIHAGYGSSSVSLTLRQTHYTCFLYYHVLWADSSPHTFVVVNATDSPLAHSTPRGLYSTPRALWPTTTSTRALDGPNERKGELRVVSTYCAAMP